jgi:hypothetical protein
LDDNGNGKIDCADQPICRRMSGCAEAMCHDRLDDDGDGLLDCADPDCDTDSTCHELNCGPGEDYDEDGLSECADPDCASIDRCCDAPCPNGHITGPGRQVITGTTAGRCDRTQYDQCDGYMRAPRPRHVEAIYAFTPPVRGRYEIETFGSRAHRLAVFEADACDDIAPTRQLACTGTPTHVDATRVLVAMDVGQTFMIVIEPTESRTLDFSLSVRPL